MRRLILSLMILAIVAAPACRRRGKVRAKASEEETGLASIVHVADPRTSLQLVRGFHDVEQNAWRWTKSKFTVTLRPPANATKNGASLALKLTIPDTVIQRLKTVTLSATVNGTAVAPETFTKGGDYVYRRDVPAKALDGDAVTVDFALDHFIPEGALEDRELGIIVASVGFEAK